VGDGFFRHELLRNMECERPELYNLESISPKPLFGHGCCTTTPIGAQQDKKGLIPMAQIAILRSGGKPLFGGADQTDTSRLAATQGQALADQLNERLREKYRNYEKAAARLELRGDHDAAELLRRAAGKARMLKNAPPAR